MPRTTGTYATTTLGESVRAFVLHPLPTADPPLTLADFVDLVRLAELALARLAGVSGLVPSVDWLLTAPSGRKLCSLRRSRAPRRR